MATYVEKVGEFDSSKETFKSYCGRMDMFFEANDLVVLGGAANAVADAAVVRKKRAIFLTEVGADSFTLVNDLLAPRSAKEVELKEITHVLKEHYNPAPLETAESFTSARVSGRRRVDSRLYSGTEEAVHSLQFWGVPQQSLTGPFCVWFEP